MDLARREMGYTGHYDYVVTNDKLKAAVVKIEKIILNGGKLYERKVRAH
jgi:guanylate kinase